MPPFGMKSLALKFSDGATFVASFPLETKNYKSLTRVGRRTCLRCSE